MGLDPDSRRLRAEIDHHLEEIERQLRAEGYGPREARREARRRFGDPARIELAIGSGGGRAWARAWDALRQDVRFAVRQMLRNPLVTGLTVVTLVVGVASTAVVFSTSCVAS